MRQIALEPAIGKNILTKLDHELLVVKTMKASQLYWTVEKKDNGAYYLRHEDQYLTWNEETDELALEPYSDSKIQSWIIQPVKSQ